MKSEANSKAQSSNERPLHETHFGRQTDAPVDSALRIPSRLQIRLESRLTLAELIIGRRRGEGTCALEHYVDVPRGGKSCVPSVLLTALAHAKL